MQLKEEDLVMCTVKSIEGTTIFLEIEGNGQAQMTLSEVAAGRIRNLREYVVPNKKIVCKVLKILNGTPQLSLRRVTGKEKEEIRERYKKERTFQAILKTTVKNSEEVINKIKEKYEIWKFYDEAQKNPEILSSFVEKTDLQKITKALFEKKEKEKEIKKIFVIKSFSENGLNEIKEILDIKNSEIHYLGSSNFSITTRAQDFKDAKSRIDEILQEIEKKAKEKKLEFEIKE